MTPTSPWLVVGLGNPGAEYARPATTSPPSVLMSPTPMWRNVERTLNGNPYRPGAPRSCQGSARPEDHPREIRFVHEHFEGRSAGSGGPSTCPPSASSSSTTTSTPPSRAATQIRRRRGRHNGLKSISQALGTKNYHRLRIGRPTGRMEVVDFVLSTIPSRTARMGHLRRDGRLR